MYTCTCHPNHITTNTPEVMTKSTSSLTAVGGGVPSLPPTLPIRHAGRAHIRGRIRRVWRPRYLELLDDGKLCYYYADDNDDDDNERLPSSSSSSILKTKTKQQQKRELKYTLTVTYARILDVTTIRDLHTGLPRGSFGFLVRGQRSWMRPPQPHDGINIISTTRAASAAHSSSLILDSSTAAAAATTDTGGSSSNEHVPFFQQLDVISSPMAAFLLAPDTNDWEFEPAAPQPIRDYLCAVPTLEDAQMWVVALQWAASLAPPPLPTATATSNPADQQWWKVDYLHPVPLSSPTPIQGSGSSKNSTNDVSSSLLVEPFSLQQTLPPSFAESSVVAESSKNVDAIPSPPAVSSSMLLTDELPPPLQPLQPPMGKILITAVTGYTVIVWKFGTLEIAYDIHALLLSTSSATTAVVTAEQWSLQRTAAQLQQLVTAWNSPNTHGQKDSDVIARLPRWSQRPSVSEVKQSLCIVDHLLRSWVLSEDLVNTVSFKQFLGLTDESDNENCLLQHWWQFRSDHPYAVTVRKCRQTIPTNVSNDQYVKEWLQKVRRSGDIASTKRLSTTLAPRAAVWALQLRRDYSPSRQHSFVIWLGGAVAAYGCGLMIPAACRWWQRVVPVVSIRLDYLVVGWASATYLGVRWAASCRERDGGNLVIASRRPAHLKNAPPQPPLLFQKNKTRPKKHYPKASTKDSAVMVQDHSVTTVLREEEDDRDDDFADCLSTESQEALVDDDDESDGEATGESDLVSEDELASEMNLNDDTLSSPLPRYPDHDGLSCWSQPAHDIFHVRGVNYFKDKVKISSGPPPLQCRGVDIWMTDNPERHITRHPAVLGGKLNDEDTFLVNFLLPFGNFVAYFAIPPLDSFPEKLRSVWTNFLKGDQQYRDARLKLLPVVVDGPWIVKTAVGPGKSPALLGKAIPLQYFFRDPETNHKGVYEVDVIITASAIAKGILSVVKSQTKAVTIAFAFIIEAAEQSELPETVLCSFQVHSLYLEDCPLLPECNLDGV